VDGSSRGDGATIDLVFAPFAFVRCGNGLKWQLKTLLNECKSDETIKKPLRAGSESRLNIFHYNGPKGSGSDFDGPLRATKSESFLFLRANLVKVDLSCNPLLELLQELLQGGKLNHTSMSQYA